jgi:C4-dicarboxylate transporter DctM subunit
VSEASPVLPAWVQHWLDKRMGLGRALPWGSRIGLVIAAVALLMACGDPPKPLPPIAAAGAPVIQSVSPGSISPAGRETVVVTGSGFKPDMIVWVGEIVVRTATVNAQGTELTFQAPTTRAGVSLDLGVGKVGKGGKPQVRTVLPGSYVTGGVGATGVALLGLALALLALLGTPLFVVIAGVACLGLFLEAQLDPDFGFFFSGAEGAGPGKGNNLFTSWLVPMGESPLFIAIPLFTFAGTLMSESQAPTRMINLCRALLGWLPGGLALVTLVTCCFFTAFTGASGVTIVALGGLLFPILIREQYPERFSLGLLTTGGSLGLLFPPSLPVIVYGLVARVDVSRLFQAALIPGIILVSFLAVTAFIVAVKAEVPRHPFTFDDVKTSLRGAAWELPLPFLVIGGIYSGVITAAEASAVTVAYVMVTTVVVYRDVSVKDLPGVIRRTVVLVGAILMIMGTALGFTDWLTLERIPQKILAAMQTHIDGQLTFLITLNIFLLIVGCLMDIFSAILVVVPLIAPVAHEFGVDPYHLAVIFLVNLEIGYSTPPVGINLFIASLRFRKPVFALYRASILFIGVLLLALMLITYVPFVSLGMFNGLPSAEIRAPVGVELERDGLTLKRVHAKGWAAEVGLQRGDKFVSVGGESVSKRTLRERMDGVRGTQALVVERDGKPHELQADFDLRTVSELNVVARRGGELAVDVQLGGVGLLEAKAARKEALTALRAAEEEQGLSYDDLDDAVKKAEDAFNTATASTRGAAKEALAKARKARQPLAAAAKRFDEARRVVDDLNTMARTLKWRSRLDGSEGSGPRFDLDELKPGTHTITATAQDKRRHVSQAVLRVTITAGEAKPKTAKTKKSSKTSKTDEDDDDWGDDDDDDDDSKTSKTDEDDDDWGDDDDDDDDSKTSKTDEDDGDWGDDDDDDSKTGD